MAKSEACVRIKINLITSLYFILPTSTLQVAGQEAFSQVGCPTKVEI
jgi:hypothetical protein